MTIEDILELLALANPPMTGLVRSSNVVLGCPFAAVSGHQHQVDRTPSLGILPNEDESGGIWNCFSCGRKGVLEQFFTGLEKEAGYDCSKALARLRALLYRDPEEVAAAIPPYDSHFALGRQPYATFPDTWLAPYQGRTAQHLLDRGVSLETCKAWGIGFDTPAQRIVFPIRDEYDKLVGAVGGTVRKKKDWERDYVKYRNYWARLHTLCGFPLRHHNQKYYCDNCGGQQINYSNGSHVTEGFRKSRHLYGAQWFHREDAVAVVVEGVVDTLKVWQVTRNFAKEHGFAVLPLGLLGSSPSPAQADLIVRLTSNRQVIEFLDNDSAGVKGGSQLQRLLSQRLRYFRARYPDGDSGGLDPGGMDPEAICEAICEAKVILKA